MTMAGRTRRPCHWPSTPRQTHPLAATVAAPSGAALADAHREPPIPAATPPSSPCTDRHPGSRAWAIERSPPATAPGWPATSGAGQGEVVIEIERWRPTPPPPTAPSRRPHRRSSTRRPRRPSRRQHLAQPRVRVGQRAALAVLMAARRSAVEAAATVTTPTPTFGRHRWPPPNRPSGPGSATPPPPSWSPPPPTCGSTPAGTSKAAPTSGVLRDLARRCTSLTTEAATHYDQIRAIVKSWRPDLLDQLGVGPSWPPPSSAPRSHPRRCRNEAAFGRPRRHQPHRTPSSSANTPATGARSRRPGDRQLNRRPTHGSPSAGYRPRPRHQGLPRPTPVPKARPTARSAAASSATSPDQIWAASSKPPQHPLTSIGASQGGVAIAASRLCQFLAGQGLGAAEDAAAVGGHGDRAAPGCHGGTRGWRPRGRSGRRPRPMSRRRRRSAGCRCHGRRRSAPGPRTPTRWSGSAVELDRERSARSRCAGRAAMVPLHGGPVRRRGCRRRPPR